QHDRPSFGGSRIVAAYLEHLQLLALEAQLALRLIDRNLVPPAPARSAIRLWLAFRGAGEHSLQRQIRQRVHLEELANLIDAAVMRDQFFAGGKIDPIKARVADGRAGYAQVNRPRSGVAEGAP